MVEIRQSFSSFTEWRQFRDAAGETGGVGAAIAADAQRYGFEEPMTGLRRAPHEIRVNPQNLHESLGAHELNSRKRALLMQLSSEIAVRGWQVRKDLRVLSASALSRISLILRGRYPFFYAGEYLPDAAARASMFPIPHLDLQAIDLPDDSFDLFLSDDVFEHLPALDAALAQIHRVLKPGGALVSAFPFVASRETTLIRASLSPAGEIEHHEPPEYHASPTGEGPGQLVWQLPAWDILERLKAAGFEDAYFTMLASSRYGIASDAQPGPFVLSAAKAGGEARARRRPQDYFHTQPLPDKLCALVALPRSGTTLITSVFSVHSQFVAVFEPWNAAREPEKLNPTIEDLAQHAKLPDLAQKTLFVKETAVRQDYIQNIRKLLDSAPPLTAKHVLIALRDPAQTFLSEVSRRNEWWNADVPLNRETFRNWADKSRAGLRLILQLAFAHDGAVIALGAFAADPGTALRRLGARIGFTVEPAQLEYEKHVDLSIVRGDKNVGEAPAPIDAAKVNFRDEDRQRIDAYLTDDADRAWFEAFVAFYAAAVAAGGVMPVSAMPADLRRALAEE